MATEGLTVLSIKPSCLPVFPPGFPVQTFGLCQVAADREQGTRDRLADTWRSPGKTFHWNKEAFGMPTAGNPPRFTYTCTLTIKYCAVLKGMI